MAVMTQTCKAKLVDPLLERLRSLFPVQMRCQAHALSDQESAVQEALSHMRIFALENNDLLRGACCGVRGTCTLSANVKSYP